MRVTLNGEGKCGLQIDGPGVVTGEYLDGWWVRPEGKDFDVFVHAIEDGVAYYAPIAFTRVDLPDWVAEALP